MIPDYTLGDTLDFKFSTRAFASGAPTTLAGTPVVSAYPDNSTTQITAGITLSVDFDSVTGLHNVNVVATSGNGYASGSTYFLVITTGTVGGVSVVGEVIGAFSLGRSAAAADLANGTDGLGAIKTDTAAILADTGTDGVVVASGSKTGYALSSAYDFAKGTAAMTEAYATNGTAMTPVQALHAIHQMLMAFNITDNTISVKQLDGSTEAFQVTMDKAQAPTEAIRK